MITITAIIWDIYSGMLVKSSVNVPDADLRLFSSRVLSGDEDKRAEAIASARESDAILLYRSTESFWDEIESDLKSIGMEKPVICVSSNPAYWSLSSVSTEQASRCNDYFVYGGSDNFSNLIRYICYLADGKRKIPSDPAALPWQGLYHPDAPEIFNDYRNFREWYEGPSEIQVGILFSRSYWVNENREMIDALVREFERKGIGCVPVFTWPVKDDALGTMSIPKIIESFYMNQEGFSRINALIKLVFLPGENHETSNNTSSVEKNSSIYQKLNVPVFQPVVLSKKNYQEWLEDPHGLGSMTAWHITMPEFEGVIEPLPLATSNTRDENGIKKIVPVKERVEKITRRIIKWIELSHKPVQERKIAFILHNNPCVSVEASLGGAAHLDSFESMSKILKNMKETGYNIDVVPESGKELSEMFTDRKAISEFRWTTVDEIIKKGGCLRKMEVDFYRRWFDKQSISFRERITEVWGEPPGVARDGVPASMVHEGKIVITGINLGNAIISAQPKRGCSGSRCDGRVCKILHDPDIPPPHQYFATYKYVEHDFRADCLVHVGTHGNLEFLPGKSNALSADCNPDIAIGDLPHLYIYNADNPPEGAIAKRRSYAVLVDHLQAVMIKSELALDLEELERLLDEYNTASGVNKTRAHTLKHMIIESIEKTNLVNEIGGIDNKPFNLVVKSAHEAISLLKGSQMNYGMHVFGEIPELEDRVDYVRSIMRVVSLNGITLRRVLCDIHDIDMDYALMNQGEVHSEMNISYGAILDDLEEKSREFIRELIIIRNRVEEVVERLFPYADNIANENLFLFSDIIREIDARIDASDEIGGVLKGFNGEFLSVGPSGKMTRGRYEIMPTGRNFYTLDIQTLPTRAAWIIGNRLEEEVIDSYLREEGGYPDNIAFYLNSTDITCADGEGMAQIMKLVGARPRWVSSGRVDGHEVIPLEELGRPRIDVTIRISGILRDSFPECVEYMDDVIRSIALLDEPEEMNYVRKNTLERWKDKENPDSEERWDEAATRVFGSKPGTYTAGVNYAVYASAWKEEKDLTDIYLYWNQYAYGKKYYGREAPEDLIANLKQVDVTFNKAYTDEYDLFGCCTYYSTHGGLTNAAKSLSGKDVKTMYGDTRDPENVGVRDISAEIRRVVRSKLLNQKWIEGMKQHGYKGLGDISKIIGRVYGWETTTQAVDDWIFDDITRTYVVDQEMRSEFEEKNPWALEEIGRRLLEAHERGLWDADPEVLDDLKSIYMQVEGWIEEKLGDVSGDFQGGSIDVLASEDVGDWKQMMEKIHKLTGK